MISDYIDSYNKLNDALKVKVKIDHNEVLKLVVKDLIKKRNSHNNTFTNSFDNVLKYYLGEDDFIKYVVNGKKIK